MSKMSLKSNGKLPLARSPTRLPARCQPLQSTAGNTIHTPPGSLMKFQSPNRSWGVEKSRLPPEYHTIYCELRALTTTAHQELGTRDNTTFDDGGVFGAQKSLLFERGMFYDEYSSRRKERMKRKKVEMKGHGKKPACNHDHGFGVDSAQKRWANPKKTAVAEASAAIPFAERREASMRRYSLRSTRKENKKIPIPLPIMNVEKSTFDGVFGAQKSPSFEKGMFYDEYSARRNEMIKRKKGEMEGHEKKPAYDLGVRIESANKRWASELDSPRKTTVAVAAAAAVTATPFAESREASMRKFSRRSTSKESYTNPIPLPIMNVDKSDNTIFDDHGVFGAKKSSLFEKGMVYDKYSARWNERMKRSMKGEMEGHDKKPAYNNDLCVAVDESAKKRWASKLDSPRTTAAAVAAAPFAERRKTSMRRYSLRSASKKDKKTPTPLPKSVGITEREVGVAGNNTIFDDHGVFGAKKSSLFERGMFYSNYSARWNERMKRSMKGEMEGHDKKPAYNNDLCVAVESVKKREPSKLDSLRKTAAAVVLLAIFVRLWLYA